MSRGDGIAVLASEGGILLHLLKAKGSQAVVPIAFSPDGRWLVGRAGTSDTAEARAHWLWRLDPKGAAIRVCGARSNAAASVAAVSRDLLPYHSPAALGA